MKPVILLCNTRTGSTAFGNGLANSNDGVLFYGEAFNPDAIDQEGAFVNWLSKSNVSAIDLLKNKADVIQKYFDYLKRDLCGKIVVFDLKYHDVPTLMPTPSLIDFPPVVFDTVSKLGGFVIHLTRNDKFASALSESVAVRTGVFHLQVDQQAKSDVQFAVSWWELRDQIKMRYLQEDVARRQLQHAAIETLEVHYEDVFGNSQGEVLRQISEKCGVHLSMNVILHRKIGGASYQSTVTNYDDLKKMESLTEFKRIWSD